MSRRTFIQTLAALSLSPLGPVHAQVRPVYPTWPRAAFAARGFSETLRALGVTNTPPETPLITIAEPDTTEGVKIRLEIATRLPQVDQCMVMVEKNPATLTAIFNFPAGTDAQLLAHIKVAETSPVMVLMRSEGQWFAARKVFTSIGGGCGGAGEGTIQTGPTVIRALARDGKTTVRTRLTHPMISQLARDAAGRPIPPWFIQYWRATHQGRVVLDAQLSTAIARDASMNFGFQGGKTGERVQITWLDNKGEARADEATIV